MGKKPKDRRGRLTSPSGTSSLLLQFVLPRTPGIYGGPIPGGCRSLSGAGETATAPATAPLPLPLQNQDGLDSWTKRAHLIAQGLISAAVSWRAATQGRPYGDFRTLHRSRRNRIGFISYGSHPSRTLCHGWSEPGAAVKWDKPKFCTAPGPSGPKKIKTGSRILRAGAPAEGCRDNPRKRGSGGGPAGAVRRPRDTPGGVLPPLPPRKKELAQRAKPCEARRAESSRPTDVTVCGRRAATLGRPYFII